MVEGGGGPKLGPGSKPTTSYESVGGRQRFIVELRPGKTTIVSWKKLLKDATFGKLNGSGPLVEGPSPEAHNTIPTPAPPPALPYGDIANEKAPYYIIKQLQGRTYGSSRLKLLPLQPLVGLEATIAISTANTAPQTILIVDYE
ncbi:Wound-responsive family protein [Forsythia ovata]|uniref:Wound-responsive family protein n=1 Tax=Forsythia ovata TaxID=205694 RepID=A0ABD1SJJ4_9LAMI